MTLVITGATGQLGGLVVRHLLKRIDADQVVAAVRTPANAAELGVEVREADFDRPETLPGAFAGADKLLLVSASDPTKDRFAQQSAAVEAAKEAGVRHIVYTSLTRADTTTTALGQAHQRTEEFIKASGLTYTFLRNNWYFENENLAPALETGTFTHSTHGGRFAPAAREDFAEAAAVVLTTDGHDNTVYELGATETVTHEDWAKTLSEVTGRTIAYADLTPEESTAQLLGFGLPQALVEVLVGANEGIARGELDLASKDLAGLLGREPVTLREYLTAQVSQASNRAE